MRQVLWGRGVVLVAGSMAAVILSTGIALGAKGELSFQERVPEFDLDRASAMAASPDGSHLYVAARDGNSLTALSIDPGGDDVTFVETETDGVDDPVDAGGTVDGLALATDVVVSPDGKHVYAGGDSDNGVAVFERDAATGRLSFVEEATATVGASGLNRPQSVAVSPDGDHVYAVTNLNDAIVAFDRDSGDGTLTQVEAEIDGVDDAGDAGGTVDGLRGPSAVEVAPDGEGVYVGTDYINADRSLVSFSRDPATGELSYVGFHADGVGGVDGLGGVEDVLVSADDGNVYANGGVFENGVAVFDRDTTTEALTFVEAEKNGVDDLSDPGDEVADFLSPGQMALSPPDPLDTDKENHNLYIAAEKSDAIVNFRRGPAGKLSFRDSTVDADSGGTAGGLLGASALAVAPDAEHVYAAGTNESGVASFAREPVTPGGLLTFLGAKPDFKVGEPPGLAISPDGENLMLLAELDKRLYSMQRDPADGSVEIRDTEVDEVDDPSDPGGEVSGIYESSAVTFSPDGNFVYVTAFSDYSIAVFSFDPATGELSYIETEADGVNDPSDPGGEVAGLYEPYDIVVSPDGESVYAPGNSDDSVAAFNRDTATGKLSFAEAEFDGAAGVEGLDSADSIEISPDGAFVYVGSQTDEAIAVFSRDAATSELSFSSVVQSTARGGSETELEDVEDIALSPDGSELFAAGEDKLLRFDRNAASGALTFSEVEEEGVDDPGDPGAEVAGLDSANVLALSADGEEVYVAGDGTPGALAVFSRDPASGALSFLEAELPGVDDPGDAGPAPAGLAGAKGMALSPDDRFLYLAAERDNSLTIFSREDDFDPPQTTITSGPASGSTTSDNTPAFGYSSSEPGSTFACSVDGAAFGACPAGSLPALADGPHSFAVAATDPAGNTDPTPAERDFTVDTSVEPPPPDTELLGAKVKAKAKQKMKGNKIKVELKLTVGEPAEGMGKGKIKVGKKSYKLKKLTKDLKTDKTKKLKLKPKKSKHKKKIAKALKKGDKVTAKLTGKITDEAGNKLKKKKTVKLKPK